MLGAVDATDLAAPGAVTAEQRNGRRQGDDGAAGSCDCSSAAALDDGAGDQRVSDVLTASNHLDRVTAATSAFVEG